MDADRFTNRPSYPAPTPPKIVSKTTVVITFFGCLLFIPTVIWGCMAFDPAAIYCFLVFPYGFSYYLPGESYVSTFAGYVIFLAMLIAGLIFRKKSSFLIWLTIYILLICLNIAGCALIYDGMRNMVVNPTAPVNSPAAKCSAF